MFGTLAKKIFGTANDRRLKRYDSPVDAINALEPEVAKLSDEAFEPAAVPLAVGGVWRSLVAACLAVVVVHSEQGAELQAQIGDKRLQGWPSTEPHVKAPHSFAGGTQ